MAAPETRPDAGALPRCTDHPDRQVRILTDYRQPIDVQGKIVQCDSAGHGWRDRHRCAWCGGPVVGKRDGGTVARPYRAVYCSGRCRLAAWRAEKRATEGRAPR